MDPLTVAQGLEGFIISEKAPANSLSTGLEGFVISENNKVPKIATGFEGIIITDESPNAKIATGFQGFLVEYRPNEKFIKIVTSRGKPFGGCIVNVNQTNPFTAVTDIDGFIFGVFDTSGIIDVQVTSGKVVYNYTINATNQPLLTTFVFPLDYTD